AARGVGCATRASLGSEQRLRRLARRCTARLLRTALRGGSLLCGGGRLLSSLCLRDAPLQRVHQVHDRSLGNGLRRRDLATFELRLEHRAQVLAVLAVQLCRIELSDDALHDLPREVLLGLLPL